MTTSPLRITTRFTTFVVPMQHEPIYANAPKEEVTWHRVTKAGSEMFPTLPWQIATNHACQWIPRRPQQIVVTNRGGNASHRQRRDQDQPVTRVTI